MSSPLVLVHGAGLNSRFWRYQVEDFPEAIALDLPGHGRSIEPAHIGISDNATWLGEEVRKLGPDPVTLIGHSMGSLVALEAAARNPDIVARLVLVGTAARLTVHHDLLEAASRRDAEAAAMVIKWSLPRTSGYGRPKEWVLEMSQDFIDAAESGLMATDLTACNDYGEAETMAARVRCPTLFVLGENDVMTKPHHAQPLAAAIEDSRIVVVGKVGHMIPLEKPADVNEAISLFLSIP